MGERRQVSNADEFQIIYVITFCPLGGGTYAPPQEWAPQGDFLPKSTAWPRVRGEE